MLTTLQFVIDAIQPGANASSVQLNALLLAADQAVKTELGRDIEQNTYTHFFNGTGTRWIVLKQTPVTAVSSVYLNYSGYYGHNVDNPFSSEFLMTDGKDYVLDWDSGNGTISDSGVLLRLGTVWSELNKAYTQGKATQEVAPAIGNIKVTYTAGYASVPYDLQLCVALIVAGMRKLSLYGYPITQERIGDYEYKLANQIININLQQPGSIGRIMRQYKRTPW